MEVDLSMAVRALENCRRILEHMKGASPEALKLMKAEYMFWWSIYEAWGDC